MFFQPPPKRKKQNKLFLQNNNHSNLHTNHPGKLSLIPSFPTFLGVTTWHPCELVLSNYWKEKIN